MSDLDDIIRITHYLYLISNKVNGKRYIGVTADPSHRKRQHFSGATNRLVNKAAKKYGKDNLTFEVLCCGSYEYIYDLEPKAIEFYDTDATTGHGYNIATGGIRPRYTNRGPVRSRSDDKPKYVSGFWFPNKRTALNSLGWGVGTYNSRERRDVLGDPTPQTIRSDDYAVYCTGFWFPNKRVCLRTINMKEATFYKRRKLGNLGDVCISVKGRVSGNPLYYRGFWFPDANLPVALYGVSKEYMLKNIANGKYEENQRLINPSITKCPVIDGVVYQSVQDAADILGCPVNTLRAKFYKQVDGYTYTYKTLEENKYVR